MCTAIELIPFCAAVITDVHVYTTTVYLQTSFPSWTRLTSLVCSTGLMAWNFVSVQLKQGSECESVLFASLFNST